MRQPPMWQLKLWPATPNLVDPASQGNAKVILNLVLYPIVLFFVLLRVYTRVFLRSNNFSTDDALILLAMIPTTAFFIFSLLADLHFMWTLHVYDIPLQNVETGLKLVLATELVFACACTLVKLSMLFLIRRVLANATLLWRRAALFGIWIVAIQGFVFEVSIIFQCRPPQEYWKVVDHAQPECVDQTALLLVAGIVNTFTDFLVVLLPFQTVMELSLPRRQKFIILTLFGLGLLSGAAGIVRTYFTYATTALTYDSTWASYPVWITAAVELYVGLICASVPATKPFFSTYVPKLLSAKQNYTNRCKSSAHFSRGLSTMRVKHISTDTDISQSIRPAARKSYLLSPISSAKSPMSSTSTRVASGESGPSSHRSYSPSPTQTGPEDPDPLSPVDNHKERALRKEIEDEFNFQYGQENALREQEELNDKSGNQVDIDDSVFMQANRSNRDLSSHIEDLVVRDGKAVSGKATITRPKSIRNSKNSYRSWAGGDDSRGELGGGRRSGLEQVMSVGFEGGFRGSGNTSVFRDFDLERGFG